MYKSFFKSKSNFYCLYNKNYLKFIFLEHQLGKILNLHNIEEIKKLFENTHNEEIINKIKDFYFNENNLKNEITKLENICHVSTFVFFFLYVCLQQYFLFKSFDFFFYCQYCFYSTCNNQCKSKCTYALTPPIICMSEKCVLELPA